MFYIHTLEKVNSVDDCFTITNATVVTPEGTLSGASIDIADGIIVDIHEGAATIGKTIDAQGNYVLPGFIDIHSDAIEKSIEPRPNTFFPVNIAAFELDKKLVACGITTIFHSLSFAEMEVGLRSNNMAAKIIREIKQYSSRLKVNTKIHSRFEITDQGALPFLHELIADGKIDLLSIMDHSPGQGQFRDSISFKNYYGRVYAKSDAEMNDIIARKIKTKETTSLDSVVGLTELCKQHSIPLASHDDDSREKIMWLKEIGVCLSEFPVNIETAAAAHDLGIHVCFGSPNVLRGCSQTGNLSARDAIKAGIGDILCSDYSPMTMLHAVFTLFRDKTLLLHEAVNMASRNPACAVGLSEQTGSLEIGKNADMIVVRSRNGFAEVLKTFVKGKEVFATC